MGSLVGELDLTGHSKDDRPCGPQLRLGTTNYINEQVTYKEIFLKLIKIETRKELRKEKRRLLRIKRERGSIMSYRKIKTSPFEIHKMIF